MIYATNMIYSEPITRSWHSPLMPPIDYSQCGTALDSEADAVACRYHFDLQVAFPLVLSRSLLHSQSVTLFKPLSLSVLLGIWENPCKLQFPIDRSTIDLQAQ